MWHSSQPCEIIACEREIVICRQCPHLCDLSDWRSPSHRPISSTMPDGSRNDRITLRDADTLIRAGLVATALRDAVTAVERRYAVAITPAMQALIRDPNDPIGRQFIPDPAELVTAPHERSDPIADDALSPIKGVVHRYPDRALLKPLLICPVYCRFCFRREHVGPDGGLLTEAELQAAYEWFGARPAIREVILTGGDPLDAVGAQASLDRSVARQRSRISRFCASTRVCRLPIQIGSPRRWQTRSTHRSRCGSCCTRTMRANSPPKRCAAIRRLQARRIAGAGPVGAAARRERQRRSTGGAVSRHAGRAGEALLPAPARSRPRHRTVPCADRGGPPAARATPRPRHRTGMADLCAGYTGRPRKGADRSGLSGTGRHVRDPAGNVRMRGYAAGSSASPNSTSA